MFNITIPDKMLFQNKRCNLSCVCRIQYCIARSILQQRSCTHQQSTDNAPQTTHTTQQTPHNNGGPTRNKHKLTDNSTQQATHSKREPTTPQHIHQTTMNAAQKNNDAQQSAAAERQH